MSDKTKTCGGGCGQCKETMACTDADTDTDTDNAPFDEQADGATKWGLFIEGDATDTETDTEADGERLAEAIDALSVSIDGASIVMARCIERGLNAIAAAIAKGRTNG